MKMKKGLLGILAAALVLAMVTTGAMAAGGSRHHGAGTGSASGSCRAGTCRYVDADGDGVCDNRGAACRYVDADDDGAALAEELDLRFLSCDEAIQAVLTDTEVAALLAENAVMDIAVTGADEAQCGRLLSQAESCTAGWGSVHCYHAGSEEAAAAREAGLSLGKYRMYQALQALDPAITAEEVRDMTMSRLQALLEDLSGGDTASIQGAGQNSAGQGAGQGAGQNGTGQGAGQSGHHGYGHSSGHDE